MSFYPEQLLCSKPSSSTRRRMKKNRHPRVQHQGSWDNKEFADSSEAFSDTDRDSRHLSTGIRLLTYDFVVRSLRRRLWKAFREDDVATATRAYRATLPDFVRWLVEERYEKRQRKREDAAKVEGGRRARSISPARSCSSVESCGSSSSFTKYPRRSSCDHTPWDHTHHNRPLRKGRRPGRRLTSRETDERLHVHENNDIRYELLKHEQKQRTETEAMIGGPSVAILQSRMNPSDPFIADDYLSPYDDSTFDHPARKALPDPVQHAAKQQALANLRKRQRKAKSPRMAFRRMIMGRRATESSVNVAIQDHDDFELVNSMIVDANNNLFYNPASSELILDDNHEEEDPLMTTPLHEAARLGAGDFVRFLLEIGGDANTKNGGSRTAIHMCAGGFTVEEQKLVKAAAAEEESRAATEGPFTPGKRRKKRSRKIKPKPPSLLPTSMDDSTPIGIQPTVIPNESLELIRELDSDTLQTPKERKKSSSMSKSKRRWKILSFNSRKDRNNDYNCNTGEEDLEFSFNKFELQQNQRQNSKKANPQRLRQIVTDRLEAMLVLLSFNHRESGEGPSINAVDHNGRTSLHYAAELGRSHICTAMLSHFGIMLTIVDEMGTRTPCEVAAHMGHAALAAELESRALLYIDPYGLDDEMMDMITAANEGGNGNGKLIGDGSATHKRNNPNGRLVSPYRWFINMSKAEIANERVYMLEEAREKLMEAFLESPSPSPNEEQEDYLIELPQEIENQDLAEKKWSDLPNDDKKPPPSSDNQKILESDDGDQKPSPPSDNQALLKSIDSDKKLPILQDGHLECYMAHHKWDLSAASDAFQQNRVEAFAAAGIDTTFDEEKDKETTETDPNAHICPICYDDEVEKEDWMVLQNCGHRFCRDCLTDYAKECANNRTPAHLITCPDHNCHSGISELDLQSLLVKDEPKILGRISEASTNNFITSHTNFRFCPHPGCSGVVHRFRQPKWASAGYDDTILNYTGAVCTAVTPSVEKIGNGCTLTYEGVEDLDYTNCRSLQQPKKAHRFCFSCGDAVHWPLTCERLEEWKQRISDEIGKVDDGNGDSDFNEVAQKIWLKANTRPCPKCKVPIEKSDGCNHMVCHSCHHEFCWICRQDWRLHSNETGGFFRCNIWKEDDPEQALDRDDGDGVMANSSNAFSAESLNDQGYGTSMHTSRKAWMRKQDIKRFLHHYSRWEAHKESHVLEQKMGDTVCIRLAPVVEAAIDFDGSPTFNFGGKGLSFIHNAFFELAECRSMLRHSYAFSFYRYPSRAFTKPSRSPPISYIGNKRKEKSRFERMQSELETLTEQMSDIVARSHLRASQVQITYLTAGTAEKRLELNNFVFQIYRESKREELRQKKRESEKIAEEDKIKEMKQRSSARILTALRNSNPTSNNGRALGSSNSEMFNRLMRIRDQRYEETTAELVTMADLPGNGRDLSMQLMSQDQRFLAVTQRLRSMEQMIRQRYDANDSLTHHQYSDDGDEDVDDDDDGDDDDNDDDNDDPRNGLQAAQMWDCAVCTFMNTGGSICAMCENPR